jgi:hypothetical protein
MKSKINLIISETHVNDKRFPNSSIIDTNFVDNLHDNIRIYRVNNAFTDDGYFNDELSTTTISKSEQSKIIDLATSLFGCEFNGTEITCATTDYDNGLARIIQCCTTITALTTYTLTKEK